MKLTPEQAIIVMGYTGIVCHDLQAFYADLEKRRGEPIIVPHSFIPWEEKVRPLYAKDFMEMLP